MMGCIRESTVEYNNSYKISMREIVSLVRENIKKLAWNEGMKSVNINSTLLQYSKVNKGNMGKFYLITRETFAVSYI